MTQTRQELLFELSDFLYEEAELLADKRYQDWLALLADEFRIRMFMTRNVGSKSGMGVWLEGPLDVAWLDEDKEVCSMRVQQIATGQHWAEDPPSRTTRFVSNVRLAQVDPHVAGATAAVRYNFLVNRCRNEDEDDYLAGYRVDHFTQVGGTWRLLSRKIYINQSVLLMGSLAFLI